MSVLQSIQMRKYDNIPTRSTLVSDMRRRVTMQAAEATYYESVGAEALSGIRLLMDREDSLRSMDGNMALILARIS